MMRDRGELATADAWLWRGDDILGTLEDSIPPGEWLTPPGADEWRREYFCKRGMILTEAKLC